MKTSAFAILLFLLPLAFAAEEAELTWLNCCCPLTMLTLPLLIVVLLGD